MRVLTIEPAGQLWGSERALLDLIEAAPDDLEIAVCCPAKSSFGAVLERRRVQLFPYLIERLHYRSKWARVVAAVEIFRACLRLAPDALHLNQAGAYRIAAPAALMCGLPIVAHVRMFEDVTYLSKVRPDPTRLRALLPVSDAVALELQACHALAAIPTWRIYDAFTDKSGERHVDAAAKRGRRIAIAGRITPTKGQEILLGALSRPDFDTSIECVIAGEGEPGYVQRLKDTAVPTLERVRWLGFVEDMNALLRTCKFLVVATEREALGRVILEAWNSNVVPIVYAGSGGAAEIIIASRGGLLFNKRTPESLAEALIRAFALSSDEFEALVTKGHEWMAMHCRPEKCAEAFRAALVAILAGRA